jgi:murein DD-endopeptidase MepM/ murein hydrolase activator NlpD
MSEGQGQTDKLTLIVVPDEASPVRRYQISRVWLRRARWIGPLIGLALVLLFADYARLRVNAVDMRRLREEAKVREAEVQTLAGTVQELDGQLARIRELERKVRVIANLPVLPDRRDGLPDASPAGLPGKGATAQKSVEAASPRSRPKSKPKTAKPPAAKPKPATPKVAKPKAPPSSVAKPEAAAQKPAPRPAPKPAPRPATVAEPKAEPKPSVPETPRAKPPTTPAANDLGVPKPGEKPPPHLLIPRDEAPRVPAAPSDGQGGPESDVPEAGDEIPDGENPETAPEGALDEGPAQEASTARQAAPIVRRKPKPGDDDIVRILGGAAIHRQLQAQAERLAAELAERERSLDELVGRLEGKSAQLASTPSIWPTSGWVTSGYGYRTSPFTGRKQFHSGLDIAANFGTPVVAPATGRVVFAGRKGAMGKMVEIDHGYGIHSLYGHLAEFFVKKGEFVERGQRIAAVGSTGRSTGPHLHYAVRLDRKHVNPANYIID